MRPVTCRFHHLALPDEAPAGRGLVYLGQSSLGPQHGIGGVVVEDGSFDWERSGKFAELTAPYDGFHDMVFSEESTVGAFLLRARREGLRDFGACMSPHTAWLILQGIETLPLRMERHMSNTRKVVEFLAAHPFVARVGHPMLESHPSHALARKLLPKGAGSVFSFDMKGNRKQGKKFIEALKLFSHLANVGDCRSLVIHPATTTHFRMTDEALAAGGITQGTIRLSIGLEDPDDLIDDLKRAEGQRHRRAMYRCRPPGLATRAESPDAAKPTVVLSTACSTTTAYGSCAGTGKPWLECAGGGPPAIAAAGGRRFHQEEAADFIAGLWMQPVWPRPPSWATAGGRSSHWKQRRG
jgi:hypothetical protein